MRIISDQFIEIIRDLFFVEPCFIKTNETYKDWTQCNRPVQDREILSHFKGNYYIGFISRQTPVKYLCFDLDTHTERTRKNLIYRKDKLINKYGRPHLLSSTPSDGLHLVYFLDRKYPPMEIRSAIVQNTRLGKGDIELFPGNNGLRLLGGKNCNLLNYELKPIAISPSEIQEHFLMVYKYSDRVSLENLPIEVSEEFKIAPQKFEREVQNLLKDGLTSPSSRNDALLKLCFYLRTYRGYSEEKTANFLVHWISTKNNGMSKDWNNNPKQVINQINKMVKYYNPNRIRDTKYFPVDILEDDNLEMIYEISIRISSNTTTELFKVKAFMEDLFSYCKRNQVNGAVEIPSTVFEKCRYGSRGRYLLYKKELLQMGVISIEKNYSTLTRKCIKYKILEKLIQ